MPNLTETTPQRVLIAGGGFAALETALALRALAGEGVSVSLISPDAVFRYRPAATAEAFGTQPPRTYDLARIAEDLEGNFYAGRVESVAPQPRAVRLSTGVRLDYDALVLAIGARAITSIPGARTFRDQRDVPALRSVLADLESGARRRFVFAVPVGATWPVPLYELALLTAAHAARCAPDAEVTLVTPEAEPLAIFGGEVSRVVADLLSERDIRFVGGATPVSVQRDRALALQAEASVPSDCVITVPQLRAHRISGVPASWWGFVPTDVCGRVEGLQDVYVAGDMTAFPVKQGGLATQQADTVAHAIAAGFGVPVKELRPSRVLQARLLGGRVPLLLRAELDWRGRPSRATVEALAGDGGHPAAKVLARYLVAYLENRDAPAPAVMPALGAA